MLLYPPGLDFIAAFCACLYAGIVAIPAPLPDSIRLKRTGPRLRAVVDDAEASLVLTDAESASRLLESGALATARFLVTGSAVDVGCGVASAPDWDAPEAGGDRLAYLQYTSGSTSTPKGVMVGHANLMRHCEDIRRAWDYRSDSIAATWLPHFHDYGLVDGLILPLYAGIPAFLMSPVAFYMRPIRWLQVISCYGVTHTQGPNFAFEHCVERIKAAHCTALDLRSWRVASNGAEPISMETIDRFVARFEPCGFRRAALYPAYGLAEATLLVATRRQGRLPAACVCDAEALQRHSVVEADPLRPAAPRRAVVSCGAPIGVTEVVIVDADTLAPRADTEVGEICISSPGLALGYWHRAEATAHTFGAYVAGKGPYLRTGDLGFLKDGELYVTGRIKDVIIIRGRNHDPHDIEMTVARSHAVLRAGRAAAFGVPVKGVERLVVVQELRRPHLLPTERDELIGSIREAVSEQHEIQVHEVKLVRPGTLPKTSSGKIQRGVCRELFVTGQFEAASLQPAPVSLLPLPVQV